MNNPSPVQLDVLDHANLLARASNAASVMTRSLRGVTPTPEELKAACGAANGAARALNRLCDALLPKSGASRKAVRRGGKSNAERRAAAPELLAALGMVRDADDDCRRDSLPTMPAAARAKIDAAISKATRGAA